MGEAWSKAAACRAKKPREKTVRAMLINFPLIQALCPVDQCDRNPCTDTYILHPTTLSSTPQLRLRLTILLFLAFPTSLVHRDDADPTLSILHPPPSQSRNNTIFSDPEATGNEIPRPMRSSIFVKIEPQMRRLHYPRNPTGHADNAKPFVHRKGCSRVKVSNLEHRSPRNRGSTVPCEKLSHMHNQESQRS